jgi:hypothetical protein
MITLQCEFARTAIFCCSKNPWISEFHYRLPAGGGGASNTVKKKIALFGRIASPWQLTLLLHLRHFTRIYIPTSLSIMLHQD